MIFFLTLIRTYFYVVIYIGEDVSIVMAEKSEYLSVSDLYPYSLRCQFSEDNHECLSLEGYLHSTGDVVIKSTFFTKLFVKLTEGTWSVI